MSESSPSKERIDYGKVVPAVVAAMRGLEQCVNQSGLEKSLLELVKLRASQMNDCAYCIDMHTKNARANGETEQRLYMLSAWRESSFYSERERAALAWTEAVTRLDQGHVPDDTYSAVRKQLAEKELVYLTLSIVAINGWNRLSVSMRTTPGTYQPNSH